MADESESNIRFARLAPIPPAYPKPWFPMLPVVGRIGGAREHFDPCSRFLEEDVLFTPSGATAIHLALRSAGIGPGDRVAVPAYHCPTMIFPVLAAGATPVLVALNEQLEMAPRAVELAAHQGLRAVLIPHFFGVAQPHLREMRDWCDARGAIMIEDCAHAFYGDPNGFVPGRIGHYAIASTRKFFPGTEGGALASNIAPVVADLPSASYAEEFRSIVDTLHMALRVGNLPWSDPHAGRKRAGEVDGPPDSEAAAAEALPTQASVHEVEQSAATRVAARTTVALVRRTDHARIAAVRRERYRRWMDALGGLSVVQPLLTDMPQSGVPYVFPALLARPEVQYPRLKYAGVQVWRWDRLALSRCEVSRRLGVHLVQLPCSQSLHDVAFESLVTEFVEAVSVDG